MTGYGTTRSGRVAFTVFYVVPLLASAVGLWVIGLPVLAGALLVIEASVVTAMAWVRRTPRTPRPTGPSPRPWLVPAVMALSLVLMVGLTVLAAGRG